VFLLLASFVNGLIKKSFEYLEGPDCSQNGFLSGHRCHCDFGYKGDNCDIEDDLTKPSGSIVSGTILFVVDRLSNQGTLQNHELLIELLRESKNVTILLLEPGAEFENWNELYAKNGINLQRMSIIETLPIAPTAEVSLSYRLMRHVRSLPFAYETIVLVGSRGIGYWLAQSQGSGLQCVGSRIVAIQDSPPKLDSELKAMGGNMTSNSIVFQNGPLAADYMQQRVAELADQLIVTDLETWRLIEQRKWDIKKERVSVLSLVDENHWRSVIAQWRGASACPNSGFELTQGDKAQEPLATVVITHYNRHLLLPETLASIKRQTFQNFELLIVDDGSSDPAAHAYLRQLSEQFAEEKRGWRVIFQKNSFVNAARNNGVRQARGQFVLFVDDDDPSRPRQLEQMLRMALVSGADFVTTGHDIFHGVNPLGPRSHSNRYMMLGPALDLGLLENTFGDVSMLVRRTSFLDIGGFTDDYKLGCEDYELLTMASLGGYKVVASAEILHWYRWHSHTVSRTVNYRDGKRRQLRPYRDAYDRLTPHQQRLYRWKVRQIGEPLANRVLF